MRMLASNAAGARLRRLCAPPPIAFFAALLAAPLLVALTGVLLLPAFGLGLILLLSIPYGAASHLMIGGPVFWIWILRGARETGDFIIAAFFANLVAAPATLLVLTAFPALLAAMTQAPFAPMRESPLDAALFIHGFGLVVAPVYGLMVGAIFLALADPTRLPPEPGQARTADMLSRKQGDLP